ncbi:MAG: exodeoxyribonuclease VII large subunit [Deltaproteobacteria bacterium]|nr:exodeoxyribonuclease VII large subunit [Deltaproteobacteria bacterium]
MNPEPTSAKRHIYSVSELTLNIKGFLEDAFPFVWVAGEVSNLRIPASGHQYFTLKDAHAQIQAVMFRAQRRNVKFDVEDGQAVVIMGRLNVYEPRGIYQIIAEYMEPGGLGSLQLAFEQLKERLRAEGLFDEKHKKPLPLLPHTIAVVTSASGAAIRDILHVTFRRYPNMSVKVVPVSVQGESSVTEIVAALERLNARAAAEVIIVARGGGSLEDLHAFNSEAVARAIFSSKIPVVSAVGHETDYTIVDFVADVRAPTPSAAAELVCPQKATLLATVAEYDRILYDSIARVIRVNRQHLQHLLDRLASPEKRIRDDRLRLDDFFGRMHRALNREIQDCKTRLRFLWQALARHDPQIKIMELRSLVASNREALRFLMTSRIQQNRTGLQVAVGRLNALSPLAVLERGFSITRTFPELALVKDVRQVAIGQRVAVTVWKGEMVCRVERKGNHGQTDL